VPLPQLTPEQRSAAAARATAARKVRADVRARLKASTLSIGAVIDQAVDNEALAKFKVSALLEAMPGIGKAKAASIMDRLGIAASRRVRGLGPHQVAALKKEFS